MRNIVTGGYRQRCDTGEVQIGGNGEMSAASARGSDFLANPVVASGNVLLIRDTAARAIAIGGPAGTKFGGNGELSAC